MGIIFGGYEKMVAAEPNYEDDQASHTNLQMKEPIPLIWMLFLPAKTANEEPMSCH